MLAGVATARLARLAGPSAQPSSQCRWRGRSAVSRQFVKQTGTGLAELPARDPTAEDIQGLMLGGEFMAGRCVPVPPRRHRRG